MTVLWCIVPEIWSVTEFFVILDRFLHFYHTNNPKNQNFEKLKKPLGDIIVLHMCTINDNQIMYGSWNIECNRQIFVILDHFMPFCPPNNPKYQKQQKNTWRYYHFTPVHHKLQLYDVWFLRYWAHRHNFLSFDNFLPLFYTQVLKNRIICYTVPEIECVTDIIIFSFWTFFALLPSNPKNVNFKKNEQKA